MVGSIRTIQLPALIAAGAMLLMGCGTAVEGGAETFRREHGAEARSAAAAIGNLSAGIAALGANPSTAQLEAVALEQHRARRRLLAAVSWTQLENGEEEGVSQAEREIHEAAGALLKAMTELRIYTQTRSPAALAAYRRQFAGGREYWNQGISQLWHIAKSSGPPTI
jgi:hypothetical protein